MSRHASADVVDGYEMEFEGDAKPQTKPSWTTIDFEELEIGERIGGGGAGIVYKGVYRNKPVAIKALFDPRLDEEVKREFMDELTVMSSLSHDNIVRLIGACVKAPHMCFVMELCHQSLYQLLHLSKTKITFSEIVDIAIGVATAMEFLHTQEPPIIHRDLKSQNVLLTAGRKVKLIDFGLVRTQITAAGTPNYMPPELWNNKPFSKKVDVYMYGVLLWEMIARQVPYEGIDPSTIKQQVIDGKRPKIPTLDCPEVYRKLTQACWDSEPSRRPSFSDIKSRLLSIRAEALAEQKSILLDGSFDALDAMMKK